MKFRSVVTTIACLAVVATLAVTSHADSAKKAKKVACPISGKELNIADAKVASYKGAKVYVCCNKCKAAMEKDGSKFATKANYQLLVTGQAKQKKCPMTGRPVNTKMTVKVGGKTVCLCCGGCKGKASKASEKDRLTLLFSDAAFKKGFEIVKK